MTNAVGDELLVYDQDHDRAHSLSATSARVFRAADGTRTRAELASVLAELDRDAAEFVVAAVLDELARAELLVDEAPPQRSHWTRREITAVIGAAAAAVALPFVESITVPAAAQMGSDPGITTPPPTTTAKPTQTSTPKPL